MLYGDGSGMKPHNQDLSRAMGVRRRLPLLVLVLILVLGMRKLFQKKTPVSWLAANWANHLDPTLGNANGHAGSEDQRGKDPEKDAK
jgi:hypothetical protein